LHYEPCLKSVTSADRESIVLALMGSFFRDNFELEPSNVVLLMDCLMFVSTNSITTSEGELFVDDRAPSRLVIRAVVVNEILSIFGSVAQFELCLKSVASACRKSERPQRCDLFPHFKTVKP
jgi:hypothetical protein